MQYKTVKIFVLMQYLTYIHEKRRGTGLSPPFPILATLERISKNYHSLYLPLAQTVKLLKAIHSAPQALASHHGFRYLAGKRKCPLTAVSPYLRFKDYTTRPAWGQ